MDMRDAYRLIKRYMEILDLDIQQAWFYLEKAYGDKEQEDDGIDK